MANLFLGLHRYRCCVIERFVIAGDINGGGYMLDSLIQVFVVIGVIGTIVLVAAVWATRDLRKREKGDPFGKSKRDGE